MFTLVGEIRHFRNDRYCVTILLLLLIIIIIVNVVVVVVSRFRSADRGSEVCACRLCGVSLKVPMHSTHKLLAKILCDLNLVSMGARAV